RVRVRLSLNPRPDLRPRLAAVSTSARAIASRSGPYRSTTTRPDCLTAHSTTSESESESCLTEKDQPQKAQSGSQKAQKRSGHTNPRPRRDCFLFLCFL